LNFSTIFGNCDVAQEFQCNIVGILKKNRLFNLIDRIINSKSTLPGRAYAFAFPSDAKPAPYPNDNYP
jgi:hypothetical protein